MGNWLRLVKKHLLALHRGELAQDLIEYTLIAALVSLTALAGVGSVAIQFNSGISHVTKQFKKHVDHGLHKGWYK